jgi:hypothetical protein
MVVTEAAMGDHGPHRVEQLGRGQRDADPVEGERQGDVVLDPAVGGAGDAARDQHDAQVLMQGDDVGSLDGDVGATAHGDAHVGLHQRGGVVDAVADHRHHAQEQLLDVTIGTGRREVPADRDDDDVGREAKPAKAERGGIDEPQR